MPAEEEKPKNAKCAVCGRTLYLRKCRYCGKIVCSEHLMPEKHGCTGKYDYNEYSPDPIPIFCNGAPQRTGKTQPKQPHQYYKKSLWEKFKDIFKKK